MAAQTHPVTATTDYHRILENPSIDAVMISTTPEGTHYPFAKEAMLAGKHVFLEKPMALELSEADDLIHISREKNLRFTIGYSQRFNPKFAYVKRSLEDGTIGEPVTALVSRHITRNLGKKISGRVRLSPAAMEATHDIDFVPADVEWQSADHPLEDSFYVWGPPPPDYFIVNHEIAAPAA